MLQAFREIFTLLTAAPAQPKAVSVLPPPPVPKAKGAKQVKEPGVYDIDVRYNERGAPVSGTFGFRDDKEAEREGAVSWLTEFDKAALKERGVWGGKKVIAQNTTCKKRWMEGDNVGDCARFMRLSESWVEKRYAAFGAALSDERGG
jgi:hypothetical protein